MAAMKPFAARPLPREGLDWRSLVPAIGQASRALARYDGILHGVPDPAVLLSPLTTQEAVLSSKIEGTQATLGEVFRFEAGDEVVESSRREDILEILNYRRALREAERALRKQPFNLPLLKRLHAVLLDSISQNNEKRTRLRVGPFADKDAAQRAQEKIQQQAGVAGAVVAYP